MMVTAATIRFLFCEKSTLFSIQIFAPAMVIKPNTTIDAPVKIAVGMVMGAVTVIAWKNYMGDTGLYEIIPGFILAALSIVIVSLLDKAPNHDVVNRFELAKAEYQKEMAEMNK